MKPTRPIPTSMRANTLGSGTRVTGGKATSQLTRPLKRQVSGYHCERYLCRGFLVGIVYLKAASCLRHHAEKTFCSGGIHPSPLGWARVSVEYLTLCFLYLKRYII